MGKLRPSAREIRDAIESIMAGYTEGRVAHAQDVMTLIQFVNQLRGQEDLGPGEMVVRYRDQVHSVMIHSVYEGMEWAYSIGDHWDGTATVEDKGQAFGLAIQDITTISASNRDG